jgi:hypothetical protein
MQIVIKLWKFCTDYISLEKVLKLFSLLFLHLSLPGNGFTAVDPSTSMTKTAAPELNKHASMCWNFLQLWYSVIHLIIKIYYVYLGK